MFIIYTIRTKEYAELFLEHEPDPMADAAGVWLTSQRRYVSIFWILPIMAMRAVVEAYSPTSKQPIPADLWSETMKAEADQLLAKAGSWWWYGWFFPTIFIALAAFLLWGLVSGASLRDLQEQQAAYLADPRAGDIVIGTVMPTPGDPGTWYRTAFKIEAVDGEYVYARRSSEKKSGEWKKLADMPGIAKGFTLSDAMFSGEPERFSRFMYNHKSGGHSLQDVSVPHKERRPPISLDLVIRPKAQ